MERQTFGRGMWDAGARTWDYAFAYGFITAGIESMERGIMTTAELVSACKEMERHRREFEEYIGRGMSTSAALEVLADLPESEPAESRSSATGAEPLL